MFATDEKDLQPIIDNHLNTGIDDITCIRIVDIIIKARDGEVDVSRKVAKALWIIAGKNKDTDCQKWKAGDGGVCSRGLEGLELRN